MAPQVDEWVQQRGDDTQKTGGLDGAARPNSRERQDGRQGDQAGGLGAATRAPNDTGMTPIRRAPDLTGLKPSGPIKSRTSC